MATSRFIYIMVSSSYQLHWLAWKHWFGESVSGLKLYSAISNKIRSLRQDTDPEIKDHPHKGSEYAPHFLAELVGDKSSFSPKSSGVPLTVPEVPK